MLHGDLRVNGRIIGVWSAQRLDPLGPMIDHDDEEHVYDVGIRFGDPPLYLKRALHGRVRHRYGDGPVVLASLALDPSRWLDRAEPPGALGP